MSIQALIPTILQVSLMLIVASAGLQAQWRDLQYAFRRPGLVVRAMLAVNVAVPLAALAAVLLLPIPPAVRAGILIMAVSPLAPFLPGKMLKIGAAASVAVGLYFLLVLGAVLIVPASFALLSAIFPADAVLPVPVIGRLVLVSILLPLAGGLLVAMLAPRHAQRLSRIAFVAGAILLLPVIVLLLVKFGGQAIGLLGDGTLLAILIAVGAGLAAGHMLGGPEPATRQALAAAAATRHPGIAALVANLNFDDPQVMVAIFLFLLTSLAVSSLYLAWAKKRADAPSLIIADRGAVRRSRWRA